MFRGLIIHILNILTINSVNFVFYFLKHILVYWIKYKKIVVFNIFIL